MAELVEPDRGQVNSPYIRHRRRLN